MENMNLTQYIFDHVMNVYGIVPEEPWGTGNGYVLRHANGKWFAGLFRVKPQWLHQFSVSTEPIPVINVKVGPLLGAEYRAMPGIFPAWHMNKNHWVTALLNGDEEKGLLHELIEVSYGQVGRHR